MSVSRPSRRMTFKTSSTSSGSRAEVTSSKSMILGCSANARAIATRCFCPPESCAGLASALPAMPTISSSSMARRSASAFGTPLVNRGASVTFSSTVLCGNRLKSWNTMPTLARILCRCRSSAGTRPPFFGMCQSGSPSIRITPPLIVSRVIRMRRIVVLPEPEGPINASFSPGATVKESSFSTWKLPKLFDTRSISMIGATTAMLPLA